MTAGLPGTGIGGIFYILLVAVMPLYELVRALRRQSSLTHLRAVAGHLALAFAIVLSLWGEWLLLEHTFIWISDLPFAGNPVIYRACTMATAAVMPTVALAPFIILGALIFALNLVRLTLRFAPRKAPRVSANP